MCCVCVQFSALEDSGQGWGFMSEQPNSIRRKPCCFTRSIDSLCPGWYGDLVEMNEGGASMAIYAKFDGISGAVTDKNHPNWIELDYCEIASIRRMRMQPGIVGSREGTLPTISEMEITKLMDSSSIKLHQHLLSGAVIPTVQINLCHSSQGGAKVYCQYTLSYVVVSAYHKSMASRGLPCETLSLSFTKIQERFTPYDEAGQAGSPINASYDLETMQVS